MNPFPSDLRTLKSKYSALFCTYNIKKEVCMKNVFLFVLFLAIALLPLSVLADKANTIDELMAPYDS